MALDQSSCSITNNVPLVFMDTQSLDLCNNKSMFIGCIDMEHITLPEKESDSYAKEIFDYPNFEFFSTLYLDLFVHLDSQKVNYDFHVFGNVGLVAQEIYIGNVQWHSQLRY